MENFIQTIIEGFDFGALSAMDDAPSEFSTALSAHLLKDKILGKVIENYKSIMPSYYASAIQLSENFSLDSVKFNGFTPQYVIHNTRNLIAGFSINDNGVNVVMDSYTNFDTYITNIYSEFAKFQIATVNLYIIGDQSTWSPSTRVLNLSNTGLNESFSSLNFDLLPSHIYMVNSKGQNKTEFICINDINGSTTTNDIDSFQQYIESLDQNITVQYENQSANKDVIDYIEENVYLKEVSNPDELLKQNKIKMTQKDCDRVSDLIKQNKSASSQAQAINQLTKALSRFVWYCKLAHINPEIFKAIYNTEEGSSFTRGEFLTQGGETRKLAYHNCKSFYDVAMSLGASDDLINAAYSKTFTEENTDNSNRQLNSVNYGIFTPFVLFLDNLKVPYKIGNKYLRTYDYYDYRSSRNYYGYGYGVSSETQYIDITLLDDNDFTISQQYQKYYISIDQECDFGTWLKNNVTDHYGFQNLQYGQRIETTLQKLRTYILKFLKDKKAGKI